MENSRRVAELVLSGERDLIPKEFHSLENVPPELEWFANISNPKTRRTYKIDIEDFTSFFGIRSPEDMRAFSRAAVISWRKRLEARALEASSIRRKLSALASLFDYLCEQNAVSHNRVKGVKRPTAKSNEGTTPALSDASVREIQDLPAGDTIKGLRDRAILATLLYHGLRREEVCRLQVKDVHERRGVDHFRVHGKAIKSGSCLCIRWL